MIGRCTSRNGLDADEPDQHRDDQRDRGVGRHGAEPWLPAGAHQPDRQPLLQDEQIGRPDAEHHDRMPVDADSCSRPHRERARYSRTVSVSMSPMPRRVEIARARVMDGVRAPPEIVGRQRQHADDAADPVVRAAAREERAVAAVVLDHEEPNQKPGRRDCDEQRRPPVAEHESEPRDDPEDHQRQECHHQLRNAACIAGLSITAENLP